MNKKVHIVYPFKIRQEPNATWELKYSLRSLYTNILFDFDITVIGDIPTWLNCEEVNCVELNNHKINAQRQTKINQKILKAFDFYDEILVFNDDIIVTNEVSFKELSIPRVMPGKLNFSKNSIPRYGSFLAQMYNTFFELKEKGFQHKNNYVTHTPHFYTKENMNKLRKYINVIPMTNPTIVLENAYHNFMALEPKSVKGFRYGVYGRANDIYQKETIFNFNERGALNNPWIEKFLKRKFPKKCKAEL